MSETKLFRIAGSAPVIDMRTGHNATLRPGLVVLSEDAHTHAIAALEAECERLREVNRIQLEMAEVHGSACARIRRERDALQAEDEALQRQVTELTNQRDAILLQARCWAGEAKTQQAITKAVGEALGGVPNWGPIAAGVEALRAENGRLRPLAEDRDQQYAMKVKARQQRDEMREQLEAARGLLRESREAYSGAIHWEDQQPIMKKIDAFLTATKAQEVQSEQGERQEAVRYEFQGRDGEWYPFTDESHYRATVEDGSWPVRALYTTPQPGPDVRGLVEALEWCEDWFARNCPTFKVDGFFPTVHPMLTSIRNALAAHRQAQRQA